MTGISTGTPVIVVALSGLTTGGLLTAIARVAVLFANCGSSVREATTAPAPMRPKPRGAVVVSVSCELVSGRSRRRVQSASAPTIWHDHPRLIP